MHHNRGSNRANQPPKRIPVPVPVPVAYVIVFAEYGNTVSEREASISQHIHVKPSNRFHSRVQDAHSDTFDHVYDNRSTKNVLKIYSLVRMAIDT